MNSADTKNEIRSKALGIAFAFIFIFGMVYFKYHKSRNSDFELSRFQKEQPIDYLIEVGFIELKSNKRIFHPNKLDSANAYLMLDLIEVVSDKSATFYLKIAGLINTNSAEQQLFIQEYLSFDPNYPSDFIILEKMTADRPNNELLKKGLFTFAKALSSDQTYSVLKQYDFLRSQNGPANYDNGRYVLSDEKIAHLSPQLLEVFIVNLKKGFTSSQERHFANRIQAIIDNQSKVD